MSKLHQSHIDDQIERQCDSIFERYCHIFRKLNNAFERCQMNIKQIKKTQIIFFFKQMQMIH